MIPGSVNLPHSDIPQALDLARDDFLQKFGFPQLSAADQRIIVTCRSGRRVGLAHAMLLERGFSHLNLYRGSLIDWKANGGPIEYPNEHLCMKFNKMTDDDWEVLSEEKRKELMSKKG